MDLENLKRSAIAHRQDSRAARLASSAVALACREAGNPHLALIQARAALANMPTAQEHIAEIEARAERGDPGLTARENGAAEAWAARALAAEPPHNRRRVMRALDRR